MRSPDFNLILIQKSLIFKAARLLKHALSSFGVTEFSKLHDQHWMIEQYHRAIKQVCHIEHFQVRGTVAIKNHLFAAQVAMCNCSDYALWRSLATAIDYSEICLTR
jgi:hypothetical protein